MRHLVRRFRDSERGAGLIEYALITSGVGVALMGALTFLGSTTGDATHRAAATVAAQATGGYGVSGRVGEPTTEETGQGPAAEEPDSASAPPDSVATPGGTGSPSPDPTEPKPPTLEY